MNTPITGALVVCVAAAGVAAGALFLEAQDPASPTPPQAPAGEVQPQGAPTDRGGGYGASGDGGDSAAAAGASLEISGFQFGSTSVGAGGQVTVNNRDSASHTVTANGGEFDTGEVSGGAASTFVAPGESGTFEFRCEIHPDMAGTLTVG